MPSWSTASSPPVQAVALKDLSSVPPVSVTWQAVKSAPGAWAQAETTNAATSNSAKAAYVFFIFFYSSGMGLKVESLEMRDGGAALCCEFFAPGSPLSLRPGGRFLVGNPPTGDRDHSTVPMRAQTADSL